MRGMLKGVTSIYPIYYLRHGWWYSLEHSWVRSSQGYVYASTLLYPAILPLYLSATTPYPATTLLLSRGFPFPTPCTEKQARRRQDPSPRRGLHQKSVMSQRNRTALRHLLCPLSSPLPTPALTKACSSFKTVRTPKTTGVPVWSWTFIKP